MKMGEVFVEDHIANVLLEYLDLNRDVYGEDLISLVSEVCMPPGSEES
jgi:hypothetical protein